MESATKALESLRATAKTVNLGNVVPRDVRWLWPARIPLGKFTLLFGDPGLGKSFITLDMAARVTTGRAWPDGGECPRGTVLLIGAEDDVEDTVAPRLWSRLFMDAIKYPEAGLVVGMLTLMVGLPVLVLHWRWTGDLRSIVTVLGWGCTFKGTLYLLAPGVLAWSARGKVERPAVFVIAGIVGTIAGGLALLGAWQAATVL